MAGYEPLLTMHNPMPGASLHFNGKYDKMTALVMGRETGKISRLSADRCESLANG